MTTNYVRGASITCAASREEIQGMLAGYGATGFHCGWKDGGAAVAFTAGDRQFRFVLALPGQAGDPLQSRRTGPDRQSAEEVSRRRWHKLSMLIRAKLEAVDSGIATFDEEFLAYMVVPGGNTVFQDVAPAIDTAYATALRTPLLGDSDR